jgi:tellurite methyltransferase
VAAVGQMAKSQSNAKKELRMNSHLELNDWFGSIDIYLFDQLLKGRIIPGMKLLDAGSGGGRNLVYFLKSGFDVFAVDQSAQSINELRALVASLAPHLPRDNFRVESVESLSFADESFDCVISSAVLHFASNEEQWRKMVEEMWRVLKHKGIFFARLASTIGVENQIQPVGGRRFHLPDGSVRFLVDEQMLMTTTTTLGGELLEPLKTVVVQNMRSMSNWVVGKA